MPAHYYRCELAIFNQHDQAGAILRQASGVVGVGGGIFLLLLTILAGWGHSKQAAALTKQIIISSLDYEPGKE